MFEITEPEEGTNQEHIWTSFVDLLGGLVAILLLTFLIPELDKAAAEATAQKIATQKKEERNKGGLPTYEFRNRSVGSQRSHRKIAFLRGAEESGTA